MRNQILSWKLGTRLAQWTLQQVTQLAKDEGNMLTAIHLELLHTCTEMSEVKLERKKWCINRHHYQLPMQHMRHYPMLNRPVHTDMIISFLSLWQSIKWLHHWGITSWNYQLPTSNVHIFLHNHKLITFSGSPVTTAPTLLLVSLLDTNLLYEVGVLSSTVNPRLSSSTLTGRPSLEKPFIVAKSDSNIDTYGREWLYYKTGDESTIRASTL